MNMTATVIQVNPQSLLVRNEENGEEVLVLTRNANRFSVGDRIEITFSGQMTLSIPPQITATSIQRLRPIAPPTPPTQPSQPNEMRAVVLQRGENLLIVLDIQNRREVRVEYPFAHHFCVQQRVIILFDTITFSNPPLVTATDIIPLCQ